MGVVRGLVRECTLSEQNTGSLVGNMITYALRSVSFVFPIALLCLFIGSLLTGGLGSGALFCMVNTVIYLVVIFAVAL